MLVQRHTVAPRPAAQLPPLLRQGAWAQAYPERPHAFQEKAVALAVGAVRLGGLLLMGFGAKVDHEAAGAGEELLPVCRVAHVAVTSKQHHLPLDLGGGGGEENWDLG